MGCSIIRTGNSVVGVIFGLFGGVGVSVFLYVKCVIFEGFVFVDIRGFGGGQRSVFKFSGPLCCIPESIVDYAG